MQYGLIVLFASIAAIGAYIAASSKSATDVVDSAIDQTRMPIVNPVLEPDRPDLLGEPQPP